jgi:hypothetical protein
LSKLGKSIYYISSFIVPLSIVIYCLSFIVKDNSIFAIARIPFTDNYVHSYSMILFTLSFILYQTTLKHIPIVSRFIISFALIAVHSFFGGFLWDLNNIYFNSEGYLMFLIDICGIVWLITILLSMNRHYPIFRKKLNISSFALLSILFLFQFIGFYGLYVTDFWGKLDLYNQGIGIVDPNANPFWIIMRLSSFYLFYPLLVNYRKDESNEVEPPRF